MSIRSRIAICFPLALSSLACGAPDRAESGYRVPSAEPSDATAKDDDDGKDDAETSAGAAGQAPQGSAGAGSTDGDGSSAIPPCIGHPKFHCHGDLLMRCNPDLDRYEFIEQCLPGFCSEGEGVCGGCTPGETLGCDGLGAQQICGADGAAKSVPCDASHPLCVNGACVACSADADCPQPINECRQARCEDNTCVLFDAPLGTPAHTQIEGDCQTRICDGNGQLMTIATPDDVPSSDSACKQMQCDGMSVVSQPLPLGTPCEAGGVCGFVGKCVECTGDQHICVGPHAARACNSLTERWDDPKSCPLTSPGCGAAGRCTYVTQLALGAKHSCALLDDGSVRCWGDNTSGQLGTSDISIGNISTTPVQVYDLPAKVDELAAGDTHTCARIGASIYCWGSNKDGQIPSSAASYAASPVKAQLTEGATSLAIKGNRTCYVSESKKLYCTAPGKPLQLQLLSQPVEQAVVGALHMCARTTGGKVYCRGEDGDGRLGNGPVDSSAAGWVQAELSDVSDLVAGAAHTLAVVSINGQPRRAFSWGNNLLGQAFQPASPTPLYSPTEFTPSGGLLPSTRPLSAGAIFSCLLSSSERVYCSGENSSGQLGVGHTTQTLGSSFISVHGLTSVNLLASGVSHSCARRKDASLWCWGQGTSGQLGNGQLNDSALPVLVTW